LAGEEVGASLSQSVISVRNLQKTYDNGFQALKNINLEIQKGEIFALLGPNGAGKTTLISIICGITNRTSGEVQVAGHDIVKNFRAARSMIGLVPQELTVDAFEKVIHTVEFTRALFGKPKNRELVEKILRQLSLWDKRDNQTRMLSGGMRRRLLIAKALSHEPQILFLDEPTAGVDVELRKDMWDIVRELRSSGVTIILTTHYIEEAEEMADRVGVINNGEIMVVDDKEQLMSQMGSKRLHVSLTEPMSAVPDFLQKYDVRLQGDQLILTYDSRSGDNGVDDFLGTLSQQGVSYWDIETNQSTLEDIFIELVKK
jgi:ABC-2 type transport system ATP-binding protein